MVKSYEMNRRDTLGCPYSKHAKYIYIYAFTVTFLPEVMEELAAIGINLYKMSKISCLI